MISKVVKYANPATRYIHIPAIEAKIQKIEHGDYIRFEITEIIKNNGRTKK